MPITGFTFTKVGIEKKPLVSQQVSITNDLTLGVVELVKKSEYNPNEVVRFNFNFDVKYGDIGDINLKGYVIWSSTPEKMKEVVDSWEKDKMVPAVLLQQILNAALVKCNIKSLELAQDVGLPPHFDLPKLKVNLPQGDQAAKPEEKK